MMERPCGVSRRPELFRRETYPGVLGPDAMHRTGVHRAGARGRNYWPGTLRALAWLSCCHVSDSAFDADDWMAEASAKVARRQDITLQDPESMSMMSGQVGLPSRDPHESMMHAARRCRRERRRFPLLASPACRCSGDRVKPLSG